MTGTMPNPKTLSPAAQPQDEADAQPSIESLHALYAPRIFRFLLASSRDRDLAQTLTQETFLRAWSAMSSPAGFRGDASLITWLTRIALNLLRDHTRTARFRFWRQATRTSIPASDLAAHLSHRASSAESALVAHQQLALVWDTAATLSSRQRTIFLLRFLDEFELAEIAAITGLPVPTVKTHLYRALARVRSRTAPAPALSSKDTP